MVSVSVLRNEETPRSHCPIKTVDCIGSTQGSTSVREFGKADLPAGKFRKSKILLSDGKLDKRVDDRRNLMIFDFDGLM